MTIITIVPAHECGDGAWAYSLDSDPSSTCFEKLPTRSQQHAILKGTIHALSKCDYTASIQIRTNNQLLVNGMTQYLPRWIANGWRRTDNKPVADPELWEALVAACGDRRISWTWTGNDTGGEIERLRGHLKQQLGVPFLTHAHSRRYKSQRGRTNRVRAAVAQEAENTPVAQASEVDS